MAKKGKKSGFGMAGAPGRPHWAFASALVASTVIGSGLAPITAQAQDDVSKKPQQSQATTQRFDIAAGSLKSVLDAYQTATGLKLDIRVAIDGLSSKGVSGDLTPQQALHQILDGADISYVFAGRNTVVLREKTTENVLGPIAITGSEKKPGTISSPKYSQAPVDIPQTITVVSQEVIKQQNITTLRDALRNVSGITMNAGEGGNFPGDKFNVRGFSAQSDMFVNGIRDLGAYSRDIFNLEQVEVTKGPNSVVSGRGSTGGTINMVTKMPRLEADRHATLTLGNADQRRAMIDVNQPLDIIGYRSAALRLNAVSSSAGVPGNEAVFNKSWGIAPSLSAGLGKSTQLNVSYLRSEQDNLPSYGPSTFNLVPDIDTRRFFGLRGYDFESVSSSNFAARIDHNISQVAQITNQTVHQRSQVNRVVTPVTYNPGNANHGTRAPKTHVFDNDNVTNLTNIASTFRTGAIRHSISTGFEFTKEQSRRGNFLVNTSESGPPPAIVDFDNPTADADYRPTLTRRINTRVNATTMGAYLFETMSLGRHLEVTGGVRWDSYDPEYVDSASLANSAKARKSTAVTGRAGITVKPNRFSSVYVAYGTSFNPSNENLSLDALNAASSLDPEKSRTYEVGSKWELFKARLLASAAVFRTEKYNARTSNPDDPAIGTVLEGKQRVQGAEFNMSGNISSAWNVMAGYGFMEAEWARSLDTAQVGDGLPNVPRHSVNLWTNYQVTSAFGIGGGARYVDKRLLRITGANSVYVPSYHSYDAVASYRLNPYVDLRVNLQNLTDKLYYDSGRMWTPAPGRSIAFSTTVKF